MSHTEHEFNHGGVCIFCGYEKPAPTPTTQDTELDEILGRLAGAASMCWEPRPSGVFDSETAIKDVEEAKEQLHQWAERKYGEREVGHWYMDDGNQYPYIAHCSCGYSSKSLKVVKGHITWKLAQLTPTTTPNDDERED